MHPDKTMKRIVNGQRYSVATATLLASDEYWDGNNFEHGGRNQFLYRTKGGAYFNVVLTQWQGERDVLTPIDREEAIDLYEGPLTEHQVSYEAAFDAVVEEATAGRPTYYDQPMRQTAVWLPEAMIAWLKAQPDGGMGETLRRIIKAEMDRGQAG
jgi:hypothetical protein